MATHFYFQVQKNTEGECAPKKHNFLVEILQKVPKNTFFDFVPKICLRRRNVG